MRKSCLLLPLSAREILPQTQMFGFVSHLSDCSPPLSLPTTNWGWSPGTEVLSKVQCNLPPLDAGIKKPFAPINSNSESGNFSYQLFLSRSHYGLTTFRPSNKCAGAHFGTDCSINKIWRLISCFDVCHVDLDWQLWWTFGSPVALLGSSTAMTHNIYVSLMFMMVILSALFAQFR